ncbi:beta-glucosidase [Hymenobacter sp. UV11]|uniref:glycoside hydrolase family 3 N-terminal domain-containing protein n=1 Tax=Hymenobacter sp. UV11 TaxID=1849735 RepID=UPI00105CF24B|nr:glycoside hydrolase family 3 N-terminal domain-containing protein [Hymenobacter sp. UV11]TDN36019.1 beta-glucosidase [Hymenobacter sp. UV11]TFZ68161.1 beta-glucosidase [Hymenobacter sp. UV11]
MSIYRSALAALLLAGACAASAQAQTPKVRTKTKPAKKTRAGAARAYTPLPPAEIERRVEALLSQMTLEEKVGQMTQVALDVVGKGAQRTSADAPFSIDLNKLRDVVVKYHIGSFQNSTNNRAATPATWYTIISQMQEVAMKETRLKIPTVYAIDAIHGETYTAGATFFPQEIAQAATRNRALVRRGAEITAYETRASAIPWVFSPVLDLGSDPRSPRQWETFGEDPYLGAEMSVQIVKGNEGEHGDVGNPEHVAACIKHFLGYQVTQPGKDRTNAYIPNESLYEYHLAAFKAAIDAGAHTLMVNSGLVNGVPTHASHELLTELLKDKLGFRGVVITDWQDIENLHSRDHLAATSKEAIMLAINAGIDMSMPPYQYEQFCNDLTALVKEGKVAQSRIDDATRRVLRLKMELGLFERPVTNPQDYPQFGSPAFERASYEAAAEALTLLKNQNNVLPLPKTTKVLVTGPNANSMRTLNGGWSYSWQGEKTEEFAGKYHTILEAVQQKIGAANVTYVPGVSYSTQPGAKYYAEQADRLDEAVAAAAQADVVVLCLGENSYAEKPGDLNDLYLSELQTQLAQRLAAAGKPVVLVLTEGRPRVISRFEPGMKAVVQAYLPSNFGGDALADLLFGDLNPSGKLPYTYPRYPNALGSYIHKYAEEQSKAEGVYNYEADYNPQYGFGTGLSYTTFKYSNLAVDKATVDKSGQVTVTVQVTNTGAREGKEAVELYSSDLVASQIAPDVRRLRRFDKISLKPGETKTVTFTLPIAELAYAGPTGEKVLEAGDFELRVAELTKRITLQ